jgi:glycosyltransferase involved in cell wall biosynthesis
VVLKGLRTTLHALQPDVIQCHGAVCATTLQAIVHSTSMDCRVFVDDHLNSDNCAQQSIWNRLYMRFIRAFYRHYQSEVRCWMPVTYASRHMLASILHPPYNAVLFPLGVNTELFSVSPAERASGRALLQVADDDLLLVSAGKFDKNKKIDLLIDALHVLRKEFSTIRLLLIGGGTEAYLHTIRKRVHAYGLEGSVLFVDFVKNMDLNRYYNAADIGIWPGTASITVLEAIAAGLPVIIPASDTSYGILFDHTCALGFQKDDAASLTEAIRRLIVDTALKNSLRSNGQTATETTLSWKKIALQSIDIYNSY